MPEPATRARLGTSAVIATEAPLDSARNISRIADAPRRWRLRGERAPEPRIGATPKWRNAAALTPPSPWREISAAIRAIERGQAKEIMKCWPCHIATISGVWPAIAPSRSAGSITKRFVRRTRRI